VVGITVEKSNPRIHDEDVKAVVRQRMRGVAEAVE
jgi:hypothetical protein